MSLTLPESIPPLIGVDLALFWAERGARVLPCKPIGHRNGRDKLDEKAPYNRHGVTEATDDEATIRDWWTRYPDAMPGIATGDPGPDVYDEDVSHGKPGVETRRRLVAAALLNPEECALVKTQSGGRHYWFEGTAQRNKGLSEEYGADFRGQGGYVIAPGSPGYEWVRGPLTSLGRVDWAAIQEHLKPKPTPAAATQPTPELPIRPNGRRLVAPLPPIYDGPDQGGPTPAEWFSQINRIGDMLLERGWEPAGEWNGNTHYTRPGKPEGGVSASVWLNSKGKEILNVKSTSTELEAERGYDAFELYAEWRHNGNKTEAARAIRRMMSPAPPATAPVGPPVSLPPPPGMPVGVLPAAPTGGPSGAEQRLRVLDLDGFLSMSPPVWLIEGFLDSGISYMTGAPNAGKTFVAIDMACRLAIGEGWCGMATLRPLKVLYLAAEDPAGIVVRIKAWMSTYASEADRIAIKERLSFTTDTPNLIDPVDRNRLVQTAVGYDLTIVDTQTDVTSGINENAKNEMDALLVVLKAINDAGKSILMIHHPNAGEDSWKPRGIGTQLGKANTVIQVRPKDKEKEKGPIIAVTRKQKHGPKGKARSFQIVSPGILEQLPYDGPGAPGAQSSKWDPTEAVIRAICTLEFDGLTRDKLREQNTVIADRMAIQGRSDMLANGKVVVRRLGDAWGQIQKRKADDEWDGPLWISPEAATQRVDIDIVATEDLDV